MSYLTNPYRFAPAEIDYEQEVGTQSCVFQDPTQKICGEMVANTSSVLYGKKITNIQIPLQRQSTPGSTVYCRHYNGSDVLVETYWSRAADTLTTGMQYYGDGLYTGTDTAFAVDDYFCTEYANVGAEYVFTRKTTGTGGETSVFDGTNSHFIDIRNDGTRDTSHTTVDINFKITVE